VQSVTARGVPPGVALATQVGRPFDAAAVSRDVRTLWSLGRFSDVHAEIDPAGNLVFRTVPKAQGRLHEVRIEPNSFGLEIKSEEGAPIDEPGAQRIAARAQRQLEDRGFRGARVNYAFAKAPHGEVDVKLHVDLGIAQRVKQVSFGGDPAWGDKELTRNLHALRAHRLLFWRLLPDYTPEAVDADIARLRSAYLARGYYDARVWADEPSIHGKDADVRIGIEAGPRYDPAPDTHALCSCLFAERRAAERTGVLDFTPHLDVQLADGAAHLETRIDRGQPFLVGRIEFAGNRRTPDATLRRSLLLEEAQPLDGDLLRRSIARLNRTGLIEPIDMKRVVLRTNPQTGAANVIIGINEAKRGSWRLSGPVGLPSVAGPLEAQIAARLPAWGRGPFELSTWSVSIGAAAFFHPILPVLGMPKGLFLPVLALRRPFLPGESWTSGIVIAPQLGWRSTAFGYAAGQVQERTLSLLAGSRGLTPDLTIQVATPRGDGAIFCAAPKPRLSALRSAAAIAVKLPAALLY
jgi:outer membrane protein insertion porin family